LIANNFYNYSLEKCQDVFYFSKEDIKDLIRAASAPAAFVSSLYRKSSRFVRLLWPDTISMDDFGTFRHFERY